MAREGINRAELARRLGVSRARVTQWLELLELPDGVIHEAEALGDHWDRQVMSEREMRRSAKAKVKGLELHGPDR
jgi:ParB-like chromosome segregation protein Spo0J